MSDYVLNTANPEPLPRTRRQKIIAGCLALAAFLTIYVLSAGPVAAIHRSVRFKPVQQAIEVAYAPIVFIVERNVEPLATPLKAYIGFFR